MPGFVKPAAAKMRQYLKGSAVVNQGAVAGHISGLVSGGSCGADLPVGRTKACPRAGVLGGNNRPQDRLTGLKLKPRMKNRLTQ